MISPKMWGEERQGGGQEEMIFLFPEKMTGARKKHFAVNSLNELRAYFRGGPAHHKETQKYLAILRNRAPPNLLRDFSGYVRGARSFIELTFTNTFSYIHEKTNSNNNNNNNHHGS